MIKRISLGFVLILASVAFAESSSESSESSEEYSTEKDISESVIETTSVDTEETCNATSTSIQEEFSSYAETISPNESSSLATPINPNESSSLATPINPNVSSIGTTISQNKSSLTTTNGPIEFSSPPTTDVNESYATSKSPAEVSSTQNGSLSSAQYTLPLTEEDKNAAVQCHNNFRSQLAMGNAYNKTGGNKMPTASNMRKMQWDDGLAKSAAEWANKCSFSHSWNGWAGESWAANGGTLTNKDAFVDACNRWWSELAQQGFSQNLILTNENFGGTGHWTQMAWSNSDKIGCAMAQNCPNTNWKTYVVCWYYKAGNYIGTSVYEAGEVCSKCNAEDKCDKQTEGLCHN